MSVELSAWDAPRPCGYCGFDFKPTRPQDKNQHFCSSEHRRKFFKHGAKHRTVASLRAEFQGRIDALEARVAELENKYSKPLDGSSGLVVTLQPEVKQ